MARKPPGIHPAPFSAEVASALWGEIAKLDLPHGALVLDPFAGTGKYLSTIAYGLDLTPVGVEIESGYFAAGATDPCVVLGDSRSLPFPDDSFDLAFTSPAYPNGVSDDFKAKDLSLRHTYAHRLRMHLGADYEMAEGNAGATNPRRSPTALANFYAIHNAVWAEVFRVLKPGALFFVNTKDPMKVPFRLHTEEQLLSAGFESDYVVKVDCRGLNHGKNHENKLSFEDITVVRKPAIRSL
jgi:DNA modification methylase